MTTYSLCKNPRNGGKVITAPMFAPGKQSDVIEATRKIKLALSWVLYQFEPLRAKHHLFLLTTCALDMPS